MFKFQFLCCIIFHYQFSYLQNWSCIYTLCQYFHHTVCLNIPSLYLYISISTKINVFYCFTIVHYTISSKLFLTMLQWMRKHITLLICAYILCRKLCHLFLFFSNFVSIFYFRVMCGWNHLICMLFNNNYIQISFSLISDFFNL